MCVSLDSEAPDLFAAQVEKIVNGLAEARRFDMLQQATKVRPAVGWQS
jgi:hypothetical protein